MKSLKYLCIAFLLISTLNGCTSSDDPVEISEENEEEEEGQNENLKLYKYTSIYELLQYQVNYYYNENGSLHKYNYMNVGENENEQDYFLFKYNDQNKLTRIDMYSADGSFLRDFRIYNYDSNNRLIGMINHEDGTNPARHTTFTYSENRVDFIEAETNKSGVIFFDEKGRIKETWHDKSGQGNGYRKSILTYGDNDDVISITIPHETYDTVYEFETDDNPNPLFYNFLSQPMQYMMTEHYLYDIDFGNTSYKKNNVVKFISGNSITETIFNYTEDNYPLNAKTYRDNKHTYTFTYEYY